MLRFVAMKDKAGLPEGEPTNAPLPRHTRLPHRILVVDDEVNTRRLNATVLAQAGYHVDEAADGAAGFEALQTGNYDLVITDNLMPKVTGVEMLKKLRAAHMALPVIMASGAFPTMEFARHPWLQPDAMLLRPYTVEKLLNTVEIVLRVADNPRDEIP
jgi:DNA-binding response OmpR family regulator